MSGPFANRKKEAPQRMGRKILPSAEDIAGNKKAKQAKAKPAETRSAKIIVYVTPSEKAALVNHLGRKSESKALHPIIKKFIESLTY